MFLDCDIKGDDLPPQTLCLTYDDGPGETPGDGPGPHTSALGHYLFTQGIPATFFVIGRHAEMYPETLRQLQRWGHSIGNHTYSHPGLVALAEAGGDVVGELTRTEALIRPYRDADVALFRAPYGNWRQKRGPDNLVDAPVSIVAEILNRSDALRHYIGPINWDISAEDWTYWERGLPAESCAERFLEVIGRKRRGIVLMHDSSEAEAARAHNGALAVTRSLVPALRAQGYRFVGLDALPQVQRARSQQTAGASL